MSKAKVKQKKQTESGATSKKTALANENAPQNSDRIIPATMESMFGSISWLMLHSPAHRHFFIVDYEWLVMPALLSKQFRIVRQNNVPVAYVSWAFLDEDTEKRIASGQRMPKLAPHEWNLGDLPWVIDVIAPFGGAKEILQKLNETEFKNKDVKILRIRKDGKGMEAVLLHDLLNEDEQQKPIRK